ncbi:serine/threonine protein kinase [Phycisphaera mikurensis]|uniref:non-specific serine/threonine protein kinase n=1 Tax=Phycisphaera mikurensis (strain NBRC 102666 / KCTC 22515 / FYK2301M01) TaxID=1142394 RepID=I0IIP9_PHYMF|nr:serine/threonine-protein kinase [Phycisphaera mikurensis]MBB6442711.1 serine/threonine-protein kinase [Phycisphaera mikurensis]BAM05137.1 putative serine/threonine protein kinase [Phycisphaera mikurensis NBRC 102666]
MSKFHQIAGYDVVETLGTGAGSTLYAVRNKKGEKYCLKRVVKKSEQDQRFIDQALAEHKIAHQFKHPRLRRSLKVHKIRELIRVSEVAVIMEMVDGWTLEEKRPDDVLLLCRVFHEIAEALLEMHRLGFAHADIKPNNIMLTASESGDGFVVKIIDFGQSCPLGTIKERIQGTPDYIAPEQVKRRAINEQTDVFCLGATMYWLLTGVNVPTMMPKRNRDAVAIKTEEAKKFEPPAKLNPSVSPALSSLVMDCVERRPEDRPAGMPAVISRLDLAVQQIERARSKGASAAPLPSLESGRKPGSTESLAGR